MMMKGDGVCGHVFVLPGTDSACQDLFGWFLFWLRFGSVFTLFLLLWWWWWHVSIIQITFFKGSHWHWWAKRITAVNWLRSWRWEWLKVTAVSPCAAAAA